MVAAMLTFVGSAEAACTKTWLLDAAAGNWSTGANWSGNTSPAATDDVCIPAGAGPVTLDVAAASVRSLQLARTLTLSPSSVLTVTGTGATNTSRLTDAASVTGPDGIPAYAAAATVEKVGAGTTTIASNVDFDGAVDIDAGTLALGAGSDSANANSGTFTLAGGTTFAVGQGGFGTHAFDGTITDGAAEATFSTASGNSVT